MLSLQRNRASTPSKPTSGHYAGTSGDRSILCATVCPPKTLLCSENRGEKAPHLNPTCRTALVVRIAECRDNFLVHTQKCSRSEHSLFCYRPPQDLEQVADALKTSQRCEPQSRYLAYLQRGAGNKTPQVAGSLFFGEGHSWGGERRYHKLNAQTVRQGQEPTLSRILNDELSSNTENVLRFSRFTSILKQ